MAIVETTLAEQLKAQGIEDGVEDIAVLLQPLLEQEAQLEWVFFLSSSSSPFLFSFFFLHFSSYLQRRRGRGDRCKQREGDEEVQKNKLISRSYISDANAQRKYEDGKALQEALNEIRAEIARVTSGAVR
jgi:hypothetical protein